MRAGASPRAPAAVGRARDARVDHLPSYNELSAAGTMNGVLSRGAFTRTLVSGLEAADSRLEVGIPVVTRSGSVPLWCSNPAIMT